MSNQTTIAISKDLRKKLLEIAYERALETGTAWSCNDVIKYLIETRESKCLSKA